MHSIMISVVVPIYNMEPYLEQCIQSIIEQTYKNIEIILVNDGSTDGSAKICKKYSEKDTRVIYIEQKNQGVSVARNTGLYRASGTWICFVDGDDWVTPDMASILLNKAGNFDVIVGDFYAVEGRKLTKSSFYDDSIEPKNRNNSLYLIGNALGSVKYGAGQYSNIGVPWGKLYRRGFLLENSLEFPKGIRRMQDTVFNINVFSKTSNIIFCNTPVYYYRIVTNSSCRRYDPDFGEVSQQILSAISRPLINNPDREIQKMYDYKRISLLLENISLYYGHTQCTLSYKRRKEGIKNIYIGSGVSTLLNSCPQNWFSRKQKLILYLLSRKKYGTILCLYYIKQKFSRE